MPNCHAARPRLVVDIGRRCDGPDRPAANEIVDRNSAIISHVLRQQRAAFVGRRRRAIEEADGLARMVEEIDGWLAELGCSELNNIP